MDSWLIRGATVVDGTGAPGRLADVALVAGRISAVGPDAHHDGRRQRVIDATGLVLAPGFIDMHAHSDLQILATPAHTAKVSQGVTCEVLGQDGLSFAPIDTPTLQTVRRQVAGWNGEPADFAFTWRSVAGYLDRLDEGIACHAAYLVPQGTLRQLVVGGEPRPATHGERHRMAALLRAGLAEGAVGMSSGLTYPPGMYADDAELLDLCQVLAEAGAYYSPHHRSYGAGALVAYAEMLDLARRSGCALHLTHATMNFAPNRGRAGELVSLLDDALADGVDVTIDTYPYLAGATTLAALLPSWSAAGGPDATLARLADPASQARIRRDLEELGSDGCHGGVVEWRTIRVSGVRERSLTHLTGRTVQEIADSTGTAPFEVMLNLLVRDRLATSITQHVGDEANVRTMMAHRTHCGGSDAILVGTHPHPRAWGTFPRYLARYVRELGVLTLEDCVHHLTGRPAARLRLRERGEVRPGFHADLVLFDPERVADMATFEAPRQPAVGIPWVFVAGQPVIADGVRTDAHPGRALRRGPDGTTEQVGTRIAR